MADESTKTPMFTNHSQVTTAFVASNAVALILGLVKAKYGLDLSGYEPQLIALVTAAGYFIPGRTQ